MVVCHRDLRLMDKPSCTARQVVSVTRYQVAAANWGDRAGLDLIY
jgi:hypothetical protein